MERLTTRDSEYNFITLKRTGRSLCDAVCEDYADCGFCPIGEAINRLFAVEDILGSNYDLDLLRNFVEEQRSNNYDI